MTFKYETFCLLSCLPTGSDTDCTSGWNNSGDGARPEGFNPNPNRELPWRLFSVADSHASCRGKGCPYELFHPPFYCLPLVVSEVEPLGDSEPSRTVSTMSSTPHFVLSLSVEGRSFRLEESLSNGRTIKGGKKAVIGRMHSKLGPPEGREVSCSSRTPSSVMRFGNGQGVRHQRNPYRSMPTPIS